MATWEDLENDTSFKDSDQEAQLCLMADHDDEDEVDLSDLSIDELHYIIKDITMNSKKLLDKYVKYKKDNEALRAENNFLLEKVKATEACDENSLKEENSVLRAELNKFKLKHMVTASTDLIAENKKLNEQIKNLNENLAKFVQGSQNVDKLLACQRFCGEKPGLGFKEETNQEEFTSKDPNGFGYLKLVEEHAGLPYIQGEIGHKNSKSCCKCFILNIKENLGKFDPKTHEGIFLGYSTDSKAYRLYNKNSKTVKETMHVTFYESNSVPSVCIDDSPGFEAKLPKITKSVTQNSSSQEITPAGSENINSIGDNLELSPIAAENTDAKAIVDQEEPESLTQTRRPREWKFLINYPEEFIIGDPSKGISPRSSLKKAESNNLALISKIEPQNI
ncbi:uncharacterized protein LOC130934762 [Arachis stenosperma]|uniref:uncharacterized protein LOC130934762 n=1 Tax=Arachis stenosperma TaxID=217475 RepID=UPI0025AD9AF6|nr:uncharacterized protein LOC130934762 [Arachis stenosperma]